MSMTIQSSVKDKILATSSETSKVENALAKMLRDMDQQMERGQMMVSTLWIKLYSEYEYEIRYHLGKANVVTDALSRKERVKPRRVRARAMTIQYGGMMRAVVMDEARASRSPVLWAEIGESSLTGLELVLDTTDKVVLIKEKLKAVRDRQKSYADNRRKPLEFEEKGKLASRYVGPFEILERVGPVAYRLRLPEELNEIKVDKTLRFVEEPVENSDREVKSGYAATRTLLWAGKVVSSKISYEKLNLLVKSWDEISERRGYCDNYDLSRFDNQSIERDRLIGIGFVLDFVEFISFTFSDKEMILVTEAVSR
ncbi:hypothetical protein Tco_1474336 [Tanacetum coccineum]